MKRSRSWFESAAEATLELLFCGGTELDEEEGGVYTITDVHLMFRRRGRWRKHAIIGDFKAGFTPSCERLQSNRELVVRHVFKPVRGKNPLKLGPSEELPQEDKRVTGTLRPLHAVRGKAAPSSC